MREINRSVGDIMVGIFDINTVVAEITMQNWARKESKTKKFCTYLEYDFFTGKEPLLRINENRT